MKRKIIFIISSIVIIAGLLIVYFNLFHITKGDGFTLQGRKKLIVDIDKECKLYAGYDESDPRGTVNVRLKGELKIESEEGTVSPVSDFEALVEGFDFDGLEVNSSARKMSTNYVVDIKEGYSIYVWSTGIRNGDGIEPYIDDTQYYVYVDDNLEDFNILIINGDERFIVKP